MISPPESFSICPADENFYPAWRQISNIFDVSLNGVIMSHVRAYDIAQGWVRMIKTDSFGLPIVDGATDRVSEETLHGIVAVRWNREAL